MVLLRVNVYHVIKLVSMICVCHNVLTINLLILIVVINVSAVNHIVYYLTVVSQHLMCMLYYTAAAVTIRV